jgi:hypothetical protein
MIGDDATGRRDSSHTETARTEITALQEQVPPGTPLITEQMSSVREKIDEYGRLDSESARRDFLLDLDAELDDLRDAIDDELDDGRAQAAPPSTTSKPPSRTSGTTPDRGTPRERRSSRPTLAPL